MNLGIGEVAVVAFDVVALLASFLSLCVVCDEHLVPCVEVFIVQFQMPEEVAAVTLVAFGSAAPELFLNSVSAVAQTSDLSLAAILGSGIIAFGLIPPLILLSSAKSRVQLKLRPILRESAFYLFGLCVFFGSIHDGRIDTGEACVLVGVYVLYTSTVAAMYFRDKAQAQAQIEDQVAQAQAVVGWAAGAVDVAGTGTGTGTEGAARSRAGEGTATGAATAESTVTGTDDASSELDLQRRQNARNSENGHGGPLALDSLVDGLDSVCPLDSQGSRRFSFRAYGSRCDFFPTVGSSRPGPSPSSSPCPSPKAHSQGAQGNYLQGFFRGSQEDISGVSEYAGLLGDYVEDVESLGADIGTAGMGANDDGVVDGGWDRAVRTLLLPLHPNVPLFITGSVHAQARTKQSVGVSVTVGPGLEGTGVVSGTEQSIGVVVTGASTGANTCPHHVSLQRALLILLLCILLIGLLATAIVALSESAIGHLGFSSTIMGATFVAMGAEIPDVVSALALSRAGYYDGAVAGAIGSQVINVSLGVGIPALLSGLLSGPLSISAPQASSLSLLTVLLILIILSYIAVTVPVAGMVRGGWAESTVVYRAGAVFQMCVCAFVYTAFLTLNGS